MKNQIISLDEKSYKVFAFTEEQIIFSSKSHDTFDSLIEATKKSGMLETIESIPVKSLKEVGYNEKEESFSIAYEMEGVRNKKSFILDDSSLRDSLTTELAELCELSKTVSEESKIKPLLTNLAGIAGVVFCAWYFRGIALAADHGEHYVVSGRRSGIKQLLVNAIEAIGATGLTVVAALILLYQIYKTYKRFTKPAAEIKFSSVGCIK